MTIAEFLLALIAIFVAAKVFGTLAERVGQPAVLGELAGGVVVGVSGLQLVDPHDITVRLLSELGVVLLLFLIGLETDLKKLMEVGGSATAVACVGVALPLAGGFALGQLLGYRVMVSVFLGAALTATSVGITARVLSDLGHLRDPESQVILGAAVVDDIIGLVLLTLVGTLAEGGELTFLGVGRVILVAFGFVILAIVIGSQLAPALIRLIDRIDVARGLFFSAIVFALLLAYLAQRVGSAIIIGSFAAGLVLARTHRGKDIEREVHDVAQFFIPIFFVVVGAAIDLHTVNPFDARARPFLLIGLGLTIVGVAGKIAAGFVVWKKELKRSVIGIGMIPRGEVGLIFAQIGLTTKLLSPGLYSAVAIMVMLTTFITPPLLRRLLVAGTPMKFDGVSADYIMDAPMDRLDADDDATDASGTALPPA
ncbi:MAG: cation:proton antiporter [Acidobacteria bacterium]|nr:cation:proton antiporter [Acidobacteriota bacterium]MBV9476748.1 cation:proton antiporter [Acidobacteriota bacterium]